MTLAFRQRFPQLVELLKDKKYTDYKLNVANRAIKAGAEWGKTGNINAAGFSIAAEKEGIIVVVAGAKSPLARKQNLNDLFNSTQKAVHRRDMSLAKHQDSLFTVHLKPIENNFRKPVLLTGNPF